MLVEIQALVSKTLFGMPRRQFSGVDYNRTIVLLAVLEKRCGLALSSYDVYVSVTGGLRVKEPEADLATALAVASAYQDIPLDAQTIFFGEIGLGGETRPVPSTGQRLLEAAKLGFRQAVIPQDKGLMDDVSLPNDFNVIRAGQLREALTRSLRRPETIKAER
jgi:DNA repair protein RadA/Sms